MSRALHLQITSADLEGNEGVGRYVLLVLAVAAGIEWATLDREQNG